MGGSLGVCTTLGGIPTNSTVTVLPYCLIIITTYELTKVEHI